MKILGKSLAATILLALSAPALAGFEVPVGKKPVGQVQPSREDSIERALALITAQPDRYFAAAGDSFAAADV
ncbi:MAG TPA: hypothetical protein VFY12_12710, partial [Arenimonas sp.]|nr:hypothetical protein [Arenimonas sp.]